MRLLKHTVPEALDLLRQENPTDRFAINAEQNSVWLYLSESDRWEVRITTLLNHPDKAILIEADDIAMQVSAQGKFGWDNVFRPNCTIYEPLQTTLNEKATQCKTWTNCTH